MTTATSGSARLRPGWWWVLVPVAVAPVGLLEPDLLLRVVAAVAGLGLVAFAHRYPAQATFALVLASGLQRPLQAVLLRVAPVPIVRAAGFTKEVLLVGVVLAAIVTARRRRHHLDRLDGAALLLLVIVALYAVVPLLLSPVVDLFPQSPDSITTRALALRADVGLVVVLLAVRSLEIGQWWRRRIVGAVVAVGMLAAAAATLEFVDQSLWQRIENHWLRLPDLRVRVFDGEPSAQPLKTKLAGATMTRAGAWANALTIGFVIVPALAVTLVRAAGAPSPRRIAMAGLLGVGVAATVTRSAFLAALVAVLVASQAFPRARRAHRTRMLVAAALGLVVAIGLAAGSGLGDRTSAAIEGTDPSTENRAESMARGLARAVREPLGRGLGAQPIGQRFSDVDVVVTENAYLQVANELGLATAVVFLVVLWRLVRALQVQPDPIASAAGGAVAGMAVAGMFLHVWISLDGPWLVMMLAGLALPRGPTSPSSISPPARPGSG